MATSWTNPTIISQFAEEGAENHHIPWLDRDNFSDLKYSNGHFVGTDGVLEHIARSPKPDIVNKTYYIRATGYNFYNLPNTISGIELKLTTRRAGRVTDDTVQLTFNNTLLGENQATLDVNPIKVYGNSTFLWGLDSVSQSILQDPSFGILLRFKSHPSWPHRTPAEIDSVELRIH